MKIIYNKYIPFKRFLSINLFGILFIRIDSKKPVGIHTVTHEEIHTEQMKELWFVPFYILYALEFIINVLFVYPFSKNAYRNISFEREAFEHEYNGTYIDERLHYAQWRKKS